jgi:hypothetical protein
MITTLQRPTSQVQDATIQKSAPNTNNGTTTPLFIGNPDGIANDIWRTLLRFDVSIFANATDLASATLTLVNLQTIPVNIANTFKIKRLTQPAWQEANATWNKYDATHNWTTAGGDVTNVLAVTATLAHAGDNLTADISNLILDAINNRGGWLNLIIQRTAETSAQDNAEFGSSEESTQANRPSLVVDWTPAQGFIPPPMSAGFQNMTGGMY